MPNKNITDIIIDKFKITESQLKIAEETAKQQSIRLTQALIEHEFISEVDLAKVIAIENNVIFATLKDYQLTEKIVAKLPEVIARKYQAIVLEDNADEYLVGMTDPSDIFAYDEIAKHLDKPFKLAVVLADELNHSIDLLYRHRAEITEFAEELNEEISAKSINLDDFSIDTGVEDAPVVKLLSSLFTDAINMNASDIHIEPDKHVLRIRLRIDGDLQESIIEEKVIVSSLTLRLKLMSGLNIAEKRVPQDGRFNIIVKDQSVDIRLSTLPTQFGETVVMRLLNQSRGIVSYEELGIDKQLSDKITTIVNRPFGMLLVTGPTGSGKTTTLYSILNNINTANKKIISAEDPIEYHLPRINQVQIKENIGLTFTKVLHSALRHDPDVIMIGEIRDEESTKIALRASMTGHLVLATLHTNDAASSPVRLISMGVKSFLIANALSAVLAQRLAKKVCDKCAMTYTLTENDKAWLHKIDSTLITKASFRIGSGCTYCNNTGLHGRVGVFELLILNKEMIGALNNGDTKAYYEAVKADKSHKNLGSAALELSANGIIPLQEAYKVISNLLDTL